MGDDTTGIEHTSRISFEPNPEIEWDIDSLRIYEDDPGYIITDDLSVTDDNDANPGVPDFTDDYGNQIEGNRLVYVYSLDTGDIPDDILDMFLVTSDGSADSSGTSGTSYESTFDVCPLDLFVVT